jgi:galactokinase
MAESIHDRLRGSGCSSAQSARLAERFHALGGDGGELFVPGRIELVGNHVDYAGGSSLTVATTRGFVVRARPLDEPILRLNIRSQDLFTDFPLEDSLRGEGWAKYPAALIRRILTNVPAAAARGGRGAELVMDSDVPLAAGLSSSSAFMIALFLGWGHAAGWIEDPLLQDALADDQAVADYVSAIENGRSYGLLLGDLGVGTAGGSQDHTAIVQSRAGRVGRYRYINPQKEGQWAWPDGVLPLVFSSGVVAEKAGSALADYNKAAGLAVALKDVWNADRSNTTDEPAKGIGFLDEAQMDWLAGRVTGAMATRLEAFRQESRVVDLASEALEAGDVAAFADTVNTSQEIAERLTGNQIPETEALCSLARENGALAATSFGAGFGGAVWALVGENNLAAVAESTLVTYERRFGGAATALPEEAGPGAFFLDGRGLRG